MAARRRDLDPESGQALPEYAMLLALIAVPCVVVLLFLGTGVGQLFESGDEPAQPGPFRPPSTAPLSYPTTIEDCEDGGWRNYAQFQNEADCVGYVESLTP